jgi:hypothetical protein
MQGGIRHNISRKHTTVSLVRQAIVIAKMSCVNAVCGQIQAIKTPGICPALLLKGWTSLLQLEIFLIQDGKCLFLQI